MRFTGEQCWWFVHRVLLLHISLPTLTTGQWRKWGGDRGGGKQWRRWVGDSWDGGSGGVEEVTQLGGGQWKRWGGDTWWRVLHEILHYPASCTSPPPEPATCRNSRWQGHAQSKGRVSGGGGYELVWECSLIRPWHLDLSVKYCSFTTLCGWIPNAILCSMGLHPKWYK